MKKLFTLLFAAALAFSLTAPAFSQEAPKAEKTEKTKKEKTKKAKKTKETKMEEEKK